MKRILFIALSLSLFTHVVTAQKKIMMYKTFGGVIYMLNDSLEMSQKQTAAVLFTNPQAYQEFKAARMWSRLSAFSGFTGGALVAIPLATVAFGGTGDWGYAVAGGVLIGIGVVCNLVYRSEALYAIDIYNDDLNKRSSRLHLKFEVKPMKAGLVLRF